MHPADAIKDMVYGNEHRARAAEWERKEAIAAAVGVLQMVASDGDFDQLHEVTRNAVRSLIDKHTNDL